MTFEFNGLDLLILQNDADVPWLVNLAVRGSSAKSNYFLGGQLYDTADMSDMSAV